MPQTTYTTSLPPLCSVYRPHRLLSNKERVIYLCQIDDMMDSVKRATDAYFDVEQATLQEYLSVSRPVLLSFSGVVPFAFR